MKDSLQVFTIRQDRSWTTLNINRASFEHLLKTHNIFPAFWKHVFTFGRKSEENEFLFPGLCRRRSRRQPGITDYGRSFIDQRTASNCFLIENAYTLRRVEENGRDGDEGEFPWSIRQTTVYHKFSTERGADQSEAETTSRSRVFSPSKSTFVLIAPSPNAEAAFSDCLDQNHRDQIPLSPWNIHRILIADSLLGWMEYMAYLEHRLKEQVS